MKYAVVAALLFCSALVSAGYGDDDSEYSLQSEENEVSEESLDSKEFEEAMAACQLSLVPCLSSVEKYQAPRLPETIKSISQGGLRGVCRDVTELNECAVGVIADNCAPDFSILIAKASVFTNFICIDKIDDIYNHWECLLNAQIDKNLEQCTEAESIVDNCETEGFMQCVNEAFSGNPLCKPGATELVSEILDKLVTIMPWCPERHHFKRMVLNFLKK